MPSMRDRKHDLLDQHEAAAALRFGELADIGVGDRHQAAEPDALHEAYGEQAPIVIRENADEAHQREQCEVRDQDPHAAIPVGEPAGKNAAEHLAEISDRDHQPDPVRRDMPQRHQHRQHVGYGQRVEGIGKIRGADD